MKICNVITLCNSAHSFNLHKISEQPGFNIKYVPSKFPGLIMRLKDPKATLLLFKSGKVVCAGTKTDQEARDTFSKVSKLLQCKLENFRACNYVASSDIGYAIDLRKFFAYDKSGCIYEPEIFPGLKYTLHNPKVTVLIFATGKYVLTGASYKHQLYRADILIRKILPSCRL
jgi:transcription initiation factor TFIID TATA-box-binding protein